MIYLAAVFLLFSFLLPNSVFANGLEEALQAIYLLFLIPSFVGLVLKGFLQEKLFGLADCGKFKVFRFVFELGLNHIFYFILLSVGFFSPNLLYALLVVTVFFTVTVLLSGRQLFVKPWSTKKSYYMSYLMIYVVAMTAPFMLAHM